MKKADRINSGTFERYCRNWNYKECPVFNESSGRDGCYISTACVECRGMADNCDELETLRSFRDEYLKKLKDGSGEILEYYRTAPGIVKAINNRADAKSIYNELYEKVIRPCVELIKAGKNEECHVKYKAMVNYLKSKYMDQQYFNKEEKDNDNR